jgi:hypothetical protein
VPETRAFRALLSVRRCVHARARGFSAAPLPAMIRP